MTNETQITCTLTLVHGTRFWFKQVRWIKDGSPFRNYFASHFGSKILIREFEWSGWNSAGARYAAGKRLRTHLESLVSDYPQASHFVIGHSHGGTAAVEALRNPSLRQHIRGVACLSTPFLEAQPRPYLREISWAVAVALAFLIGYFAAFPLARVTHTFFIEAFMIVAVPALVPTLLWRRHWQRFALRTVDKIVVPDLQTSNLLILRVAGDEVSALFGGSRLLAWILAALNASIARPVAFMMGKRSSLLSVLARVVVIYAIATSIAATIILSLAWVVTTPTDSEVLGDAIILSAMLIFIIPFLALAAFSVAIPILILSSVVSSPFGTDVGYVGLLVDAVAEPVPPGRWNIVHVGLVDSEIKAGLRHSAAYDSERVMKVIEAWITSSCAES